MSQSISEQLHQQFGEIDIYLFDQLLRGRLDGSTAVLDAGCGSGRNLIYLVRAGLEVYGVDRDPAAVDGVRARARELNPDLPPENFVVGELEALPWPDDTMDAVLCSAVLHFARDEEHFGRITQEMWRVLRPGGLFFARLASNIGLEGAVTVAGDRRARLPDGSIRFLVDEAYLLEWGEILGGTLLDPLKTTNVQNLRCMTTWVMRKA